MTVSFGRALCVVAALALGGCNCKETCFFTPVTGPGEINHNPGVVGRPYTVKMPVPGNTSSCGENKFATSVTVRVVDPNNMPVDATTGSSLDGERTPAEITFTPVLPGPYHLTARFEPSFGLVQTDVWIAADRSDAGTHSLPVPFECARWDQLDDRVFCISPDAGMLGVVIDGGVVATVPAYDFALSPELSGVWVVAPGDGVSFAELQFHQLDAGTLTLVDQFRLDDVQAGTPSSCRPDFCPPGTFSILDAHLADRDGTALVLLPPVAGFANVDAGHVFFRSIVDVSGGTLPSTPFAQWGPGDAVAVAGPAPFALEICQLPFDGGFTSPCEIQFASSTGQPQGGATAAGVWLFNATTVTLDGLGLPPSGGSVSTHLALIPPDVPTQWPAIDTAPHWTQQRGLVVLGASGSDLAFEFFDFDTSDARWWGVDARRYWKWSASTGQLTWIDR